MTIDTMRDLLVHELQDLYSAERQLVAALPTMVKAATSPSLASALRDHLEQTVGHVTRLEECFSHLDVATKAIKCKGMEGLLKEGAEMAEEDGNPLVRDAGIIGAAQRVEHYEIAAYGTSVELASVVGEEAVATLLRLTLEEERAADALLTSIAEADVNPLALLSGEPAGAPDAPASR